MPSPIPQRSGTVVFAGGGCWWPAVDDALPGDGLVLSDPQTVLVAQDPGELPELLRQVEREQNAGRYVAGYLSYEAGAAFGLTVLPPSPRTGSESQPLPLAWMAIYEPERATIVPATEWRALLAQVDTERAAVALAGARLDLNVSRDEYVRAIDRVRGYIAAGDTYQVNYTVRARFELGGLDPLEYFLALLLRQPVPYAAYLDLGDAQIISLSPEMLLRRRDRQLESRPMKGTRPRGATNAKDVALAYELAETEKERAENLMIVDMVRNDLGRVCRAGSVHVPTLFAVEPYRTVWQMVSTVAGEAHPHAPLGELMQAVFPGASITGAPKHHTMEIIAELETEPREVYTGAVGLFLPGGDFTTNVAIRTIVHRRGRCTLGIGSGVVWDAVAGAEYQETLVKGAFATPAPAEGSVGDSLWRPDPTAALRKATTQDDFYLFETILLDEVTADAAYRVATETVSPLHSLSDEAILARFRFLDPHLERMAASAKQLGLPFEIEGAREVMVGLARVHPEALVARIQVDAAGDFSMSTREPPARPGGVVDLLVSPFRTDPDDPLLQHKTSLRGFYNREHRRALSNNCLDVVFLNRLDHVTEGAITNVFVKAGGRWITPPLEDGLLPGVWRRWFAAQNDAIEASLRLEDLRSAEEIIIGNSVRGTVKVGRLITEPLVS